MSSGAIWTAGIYILALRALNVKIVVINQMFDNGYYITVIKVTSSHWQETMDL